MIPQKKKKEFSKFKNVFFSKNIKNACFDADLIIIHTDWEEFKALDFKKLSSNKNLKIFDMRNLYNNDSMKKTGIDYFSIGRKDS